jgi:biotin transport system substrate-specific component
MNEAPQRRPAPRLRLYLTAGLMAALTAAGAFIKIPMPVLMPITLQILFTSAAGLLLGPKWGAVSQGVYLLLGLSGLPVFINGGGPAYVLQPSFGFLLGLIPMALVSGLLSGRQSGFWRLALAGLAGLAALYAVGLPYLYLIVRFYLGKPLSVETLFVSYFLVFLPGDLLKIAAAGKLSARLRRIPVLAAYAKDGSGL